MRRVGTYAVCCSFSYHVIASKQGLIGVKKINTCWSFIDHHATALRSETHGIDAAPDIPPKTNCAGINQLLKPCIHPSTNSTNKSIHVLRHFTWPLAPFTLTSSGPCDHPPRPAHNSAGVLHHRSDLPLLKKRQAPGTVPDEAEHGFAEEGTADSARFHSFAQVRRPQA
jgi:hypothetical protein